MTNNPVPGPADTVMAFFAALDERDHAGVAGLMAPDGTWHRQGKALTGPDAVRQALELRPANRSTCHIVTNVRTVRAEDRRVLLAYYLTAYEAVDAGDGTPPASRLAGILACEDLLEQRDEGWRIVNKTSRRVIGAPVALHAAPTGGSEPGPTPASP